MCTAINLGSANILKDENGYISAIMDLDWSQFLPFGWNSCGTEMLLSVIQQVPVGDGKSPFGNQGLGK